MMFRRGKLQMGVLQSLKKLTKSLLNSHLTRKSKNKTTFDQGSRCTTVPVRIDGPISTWWSHFASHIKMDPFHHPHPTVLITHTLSLHVVQARMVAIIHTPLTRRHKDTTESWRPEGGPRFRTARSWATGKLQAAVRPAARTGLWVTGKLTAKVCSVSSVKFLTLASQNTVVRARQRGICYFVQQYPINHSHMYVFPFLVIMLLYGKQKMINQNKFKRTDMICNQRHP